VADPRRIDGIPLQHVVDAGHDVPAVLVAPRAPRRPFERVAVAGGAAEVGVEDEVAVLVKDNSRTELNAKAIEAGVEAPEDMKDKTEVAQAIVDAKARNTSEATS